MGCHPSHWLSYSSRWVIAPPSSGRIPWEMMQTMSIHWCFFWDDSSNYIHKWEHTHTDMYLPSKMLRAWMCISHNKWFLNWSVTFLELRNHKCHWGYRYYPLPSCTSIFEGTDWWMFFLGGIITQEFSAYSAIRFGLLGWWIDILRY